MARVLVVHRERGPRKFLIALADARHEARGVEHLARATKAIASFRPEVLVVGLDGKRSEVADSFRYLRQNRINLPVILFGPAGAGVLQPMAMKHGASAFLEYPMERDALDQAISGALQDDQGGSVSLPPLTREELDANLSELEKELNGRMVCFGGRNQVYLQSLILGNGRTSPPRIALKCALRQRFHHPYDVYYEYIRDVCCGDPTPCPAYQEFEARKPT